MSSFKSLTCKLGMVTSIHGKNNFPFSSLNLAIWVKILPQTFNSIKLHNIQKKKKKKIIVILKFILAIIDNYLNREVMTSNSATSTLLY